MRKKVIRWSAAALLSAGGVFAASAGVFAAEGSAAPGAEEAGTKPAAEGKASPVADDAGAKALAFLKSLEFSGGITAGWFYASNPGPHTSDNEALVSNFLVGIASADKKGFLGFEAAVGETSTPSVLTPPEQNRDLKIEFASVAVRPFADAELVVGLLKPVAGYEDTYTYNNRNVVHGIVAAQQPYNAYGARAKYSIAGIELDAGYYSKRLAEEEYAVDRDGDGENDKTAGRSWEVAAGGEVAGLAYKVYHYHLEGMKCLTGAVLEYTLGNVYLALNADYWRWNRSLSDFYGRRYAAGIALYVAPSFGNFSVPLRLEYVDQGKSRIYVDDTSTRTLWSATVTPTYRVTEKTFVRAEASYVRAKNAFADDGGHAKDDRVYVAGELAYVF